MEARITAERMAEPDRWVVDIDPDLTEEDLAQAMVAIFAQITVSFPNLNIMTFQFKMAGAMRAAAMGSPAPTPPPAA